VKFLRFLRENWLMLAYVLTIGLCACAITMLVRGQAITADGKLIEWGPWALVLWVSSMIAVALTVIIVVVMVDALLRWCAPVENWTAIRVRVAAVLSVVLSVALAVVTCVYCDIDMSGDYVAVATIVWTTLLVATIVQLGILLVELHEADGSRKRRRPKS